MAKHETAPISGALNVSEAARILGVSAVTLRQWTDAGKIACQRTPGGYRIYDLAAINAFKKARASA